MEQTGDDIIKAFKTVNEQLERQFERNRVLQRVEIEVLPPSLVPEHLASTVQVDGRCIAIPKVLIALAFVHARRVFFDECSPSDTKAESTLSASKRKLGDRDQYARLMLVYDPEIHAATNYRKKCIIWAQKQRSDSYFHSTIMCEVVLLDSLLTSPLPRHTKSPNLWYHRFWLLSTFGPSSHGSEGFFWRQKIPYHRVKGIILSEMNIVHRAGERHPKNYYAFNYARNLVKLFLTGRLPGTGHMQAAERSSVLREIISKHHDWCFQHLSDCSGWDFLRFLLETHDVHALVEVRVAFSITSLTLSRVASLNWTGQSVWNLLKIAIGEKSLLTDLERLELRAQVESLLSEVDTSSKTESRDNLAAAAYRAMGRIQTRQHGR